MKTLLITIFLFSLSFAALSQGYINTFNAFAPTPGGELAYVRGRPANDHSIGPLLSKQFGRVEILSADGLVVLSPSKDGSGDRLAVDGLFSLGVTAIPGSIPGSPASIILRIWDSSTGVTYASALDRNETLVYFPSVGSSASPSNFVSGSNFTGLGIYYYFPEPPTVTLAAIGLVGLFLCVRRKSRNA